MDSVSCQPGTALINPCSRWLGLICQEVTVVSSGCSCGSLLWNVLLWPLSGCVRLCERKEHGGQKSGAEQKVS